jgi:hypothetical protein
MPILSLAISLFTSASFKDHELFKILGKDYHKPTALLF